MSAYNPIASDFITACRDAAEPRQGVLVYDALPESHHYFGGIKPLVC
jgi:hypothetical protein